MVVSQYVFQKSLIAGLLQSPMAIRKATNAFISSTRVSDQALNLEVGEKSTEVSKN